MKRMSLLNSTWMGFLVLLLSSFSYGGNSRSAVRSTNSTRSARNPKYEALLLKKEWLKHYFMALSNKEKGPMYDVHTLDKILPQIQKELARVGHIGIVSAIRRPHSQVRMVEYYIEKGMFWGVIHFRNSKAIPKILIPITIKKFAFVTTPPNYQSPGTPYQGKIKGLSRNNTEDKPKQYEENAIRLALATVCKTISRGEPEKGNREKRISGIGPFEAKPILDGYSTKAQAYLAEFGYCEIQDMLINGHSITIWMTHTVPKDKKKPYLHMFVLIDYDRFARFSFMFQDYANKKWEKPRFFYISIKKKGSPPK